MNEQAIPLIALIIVCIVWVVFVVRIMDDGREAEETTETETTVTEEETTEPAEPLTEIDEELELPPDANAYRRVIIFPEYVIKPAIIEYSEDEELELAAPETEEQNDETVDFVPFTTYVRYNDGKRVPFRFSEYGQKTVYDTAEKYGLPYRTVLAILGVETDWNENDAHRETNDGTRYIGIGCICEKYHAENLAKQGIDIYTLKGNIEGVCYLLKAQYDRFGNLNHAIMAYNAGGGYTQGQVEKGVTENGYSRKVMAYAESFE